MQFLKTALWVILAVAIALFSKANWDSLPVQGGRVPIKLWDEWVAYVRLPNIIIVSFLLGFLPTWGFARMSRWGIRRRLQTAEQALAASTPAAPPAEPSTPLPIHTSPIEANPTTPDGVAETKL